MQNANHHLQCPSSPFPCHTLPHPQAQTSTNGCAQITNTERLPSNVTLCHYGGARHWPLMDDKDSTTPKNPTRASAHNDQGQLPLLLFCAWTHTDYSERRLDAMTFCGHQIKAQSLIKSQALTAWALLYPPSWPSWDPTQWHCQGCLWNLQKVDYLHVAAAEGDRKRGGPRTRKCK